MRAILALHLAPFPFAPFLVSSIGSAHSIDPLHLARTGQCKGTVENIKGVDARVHGYGFLSSSRLAGISFQNSR
ncbi:hypothetical protein IE53DRAFT_387711 [Violaceomyces palustris]|uniref:Uncharacterized protein n=1 Tax=Violaceomyces palustris TaxID=1673888 RepID=A0ACD0NW31_9BASI|nr:hypothetical protein IE53DRAFT_387711 [Violaceomyces palustris]